MSNTIIIKERFKDFDKKIQVDGDKSLSIRWVLFASIANTKSIAQNLLLSEDVMAAINAIRKLGIKVTINKKTCAVYGKGIDGYQYKKNLTINAKNSGTLGRLILGLLINTPYPIKLIGDKSLSKRDFKRVSDPLSIFGANFKLTNNKNLPLKIYGSPKLKPIKYIETRGSAQCKSSIIFAGMRTDGTTYIKAKKSRNHTELLCKYLKLPIKIKEKKKYDLIEIKKINKLNPLNYDIPSDLSSSSFFIVLTALAKNSNLLIKNVNINPSRTGVINILKKMVNEFPDSPSLLNRYAWRMTEVNKELNDALEKINTGLSLTEKTDSSYPALLDTKAEVLWKMDLFDEAIKVINEAISIDKDSEYYNKQKKKFQESKSKIKVNSI